MPQTVAPQEPVAAIDIGTNSVHLVVARLEASGHMTILDSDKVTLRLGQLLDSDNNFPDEAIAKAVAIIRQMQQIAGAYTTRIRAVATHATRVAGNHLRFLSSIKDATGIEPEVIDGVEEARLSFLGMRYGLNLGEVSCLGCDIGGGSTELIVASGEDVRFVTSLKLGAVTLTKQHFGNKNPSKGDVKDLDEHIYDRLATLQSDLKKLSLERAIVASGTAKALAEIHWHDKHADELRDPNGYVLTAGDLDKIVDKLEDLREPSKIRDWSGVDPARSEIILAGGLILKHITKIFGIKQWTVSGFGLREGIVVDTYTRLQGRVAGDHADIRGRSIGDFARRLRVDQAFASQVTQMALQIFDGVVERCLSKLDRDAREAARELLRGASELHEVGKFLSYSRYHRHSCYLISNSSLMGFTQNEKHIMGLVARFHRKAVATPNAEELGPITSKEVAKVNVLASCLRLAAAWSRTRQGRIQRVVTSFKDNTLEFTGKYTGDEVPEVEMHMAKREQSALAKGFGFEVKFRLER